MIYFSLKAYVITATILCLLVTGQYANASTIPGWIKNTAGWWADDTITDSEFVKGIEFLIAEKILVVPPTKAESQEKSAGIPKWVKNNAGWWSDGTINDEEFVNSIQYLLKVGIISIGSQNNIEADKQLASSDDSDSQLKALQNELEECKKITKASQRIDCEKPVKHKIIVYEYKKEAKVFEVGPINFYWNGLPSDGNSFEITQTGQAILSLRFLAENTRGTDNVSLFCTGPAVCNYVMWNGEKEFKYSGMDFTNGQIVLKPNDAREFNMLFGPNIGYGGTKFEYDSSKQYYFRISEPWGSFDLPIDLK